MPKKATTRPLLEKEIERKVCEYAKKLGFYCRKFTSPANRAVPDRLFINGHGYHFFIEFKRQGCEPTLAQEKEHQELRRVCANVQVIDNVLDGYELLDLYTDKEVTWA